MSSVVEEIEPISLELFRGDDKQLGCAAKDSAGAKVAVTGLTIVFEVREEIGGTVVFTLTTPTEIEITNGADGEFTVKIPNATLTAMDAHETYYYHCTVDFTAPNGIKTVAHGVFEVLDK